MKKRELHKLIPFGIASALVITVVARAMLTPSYLNADGITITYIVSDPVKFGGFGLAIVLTLILLNKPAWKYAFAVLTIFALTPVISYYSYTVSVGSGKIEIELTALGILIFHLLVNRDVVASFKSSLKSPNQTDESKIEKFEASVQRFESKFEGTSQAELRRMVAQNSLVPEAIEAAKRLLDRDKSATTHG